MWCSRSSDVTEHHLLLLFYLFYYYYFLPKNLETAAAANESCANSTKATVHIGPHFPSGLFFLFSCELLGFLASLCAHVTFWDAEMTSAKQNETELVWNWSHRHLNIDCETFKVYLQNCYNIIYIYFSTCLSWRLCVFIFLLDLRSTFEWVLLD